MYRIINTAPGPRGFHVVDQDSKTDPKASVLVTVPAKSHIFHDLTAEEAEKLSKWDALTVQDVGDHHEEADTDVVDAAEAKKAPAKPKKKAAAKRKA